MVMGEMLNMSKKEIDRYTIIQKVLNKELKQNNAAKLLEISTRQLRNLQVQVQKEGPAGVISKHRGKSGSRNKPEHLKQRTLALIKEKYEDCGPTFISEKLKEWHDISLSEETLRLWMISAHLWIPKISRKKEHRLRLRRECFGELIQGDASIHHWFGEELPLVAVTVLIDDATSTITSLVFSEGETTESYFCALEEHIRNYGIPRALYTDKDSVFVPARGVGTTQVNRALIELGIELILAHSAQAKGRVERANRTLQDRLFKELKLRGIKTIEQANAYAKEFVNGYNKKFSKKPKSNFNAHRPLDGYDIQRILSVRETRTVLSDCIFQYNKTFFVIQNVSEPRRLKGMKVDIYVDSKRQMRVFLKDQEVAVKIWGQYKTPSERTRKEVILRKLRGCRPQPPKHPWKHFEHSAAFEREIKAKIREEMGLVI
jgi:hypothetical protein